MPKKQFFNCHLPLKMAENQSEPEYKILRWENGMEGSMENQEAGTHPQEIVSKFNLCA